MGLFNRHKTEEVKTNAPSQTSNALAAAVGLDMNTPPEGQPSAKLTPPPTPGGTFDDIKSQVTSNTPPTTSQIPVAPVAAPTPESNEEDSLFDISDLELPQDEAQGLNQSDSVEPQEIEMPKRNESTVDTSLERSGDLSFISNKNVAAKISSSSYYVTTQQFRTLLEIVEAVKVRVKEASETHLRLLDIKSEEDIEYENLRKDFQFIEDKLYELDGIIFEK